MRDLKPSRSRIFLTFFLLFSFTSSLQAQSLQISNLSNGDRFVLPAVISPQVEVAGNWASTPTLNFYVNGALVGNEPPRVEMEGHYQLKVVASDNLGTTRTASVFVSLLEKPIYEAVVIPEFIRTYTYGGGVRYIASLLVASEQFDVRSVNINTLGLFLTDRSRKPLNQGPLRPTSVQNPKGDPRIPVKCEAVPADLDYINLKQKLAPTEPCICVEETPAEEIQFKNGYLRVRFDSFIPNVNSIPAELTLIGRSFTTSGEVAFDLEGSSLSIINPDPLSALASMGLLSSAPAEVVVSAAPPVCQWKDRLRPYAKDEHHRNQIWEGMPVCGIGRSLAIVVDGLAHGKLLTGSGFAMADMTCSATQSDSSAVGSGFVYSIWLEGDDCEKPSIGYTLSPRVKIYAEASGNPLVHKKAVIGAFYKVSANGDQALATGAVGAGNDLQSTFKFGKDPGLEITLDQTENPITRSYSDTLSRNIQSNALTISAVNELDQYLAVQGGIFGGTQANTELLEASPRIDVSARCGSKCKCKAAKAFKLY